MAVQWEITEVEKGLVGPMELFFSAAEPRWCPCSGGCVVSDAGRNDKPTQCLLRLKLSIFLDRTPEWSEPSETQHVGSVLAGVRFRSRSSPQSLPPASGRGSASAIHGVIFQTQHPSLKTILVLQCFCSKLILIIISRGADSELVVGSFLFARNPIKH